MRIFSTLPTIGRVNPLVPAAGVIAGAVLFALGHQPIGVGVAIGAVLALMNGVVLSQRVEAAADTGDFGRGLLVMQVGLLVMATVIGLTTVLLIHFSLAMTVACAAGFVATHLAILAVFYLTRARYIDMENAA